MRARAWRAAVLACFVVFGTVAAGAESAGAADTDSFTTAKIPAAGVSVGYPSSWVEMPVTARSLRAQAKRIEAKKPTAARQLRELAREPFARQAKLAMHNKTGDSMQQLIVAVDPDAVAPSNLEAFRTEKERASAREGFDVINAVALNDPNSYRIDVRRRSSVPGSGDILTSSVFSYRPSSGAIVTSVSARDDDSGHALIERILGTLRPL